MPVSVVILFWMSWMSWMCVCGIVIVVFVYVGGRRGTGGEREGGPG